MAIKGITFVFEGNTVKLNEAMTKVNRDANLLNTELRSINKLLKLDSSNVIALKQKQDILTESIENTTERLKYLKNAQNQIDSGEISVSTNKYRELEREIGFTERALKEFVDQQNATEKALKSKNNQLDKSKTSLKQYENSLNSVDNSLRSFGYVALAGITAVTGGLLALGTISLTTASNLQEVQNIVDTTFKNSTEEIENFAKTANVSYGLSELNAKKYVGVMGAMLKSSQLNNEEVLKHSILVTGLVGDFASFYNLDHETAFQKIRAGVSGETEPLKQLGINMNVANLEAYSLTKGIGKLWSEMDQQEQVLTRLNYLYSVSTDAQGDFLKTSDQFANQQRIIKTELENVSTTIGDSLIPVMSKLSDQTITSLRSDETQKSIKELTNTIDDAGQEILEISEDVVPNLINGATWFLKNIPSIAKVTAGLTGTYISLRVAINGGAAIKALSSSLLALSANPIGLTIAGIGTLISLGWTFSEVMKEQKSESEKLAEGIENLSNKYEEQIESVNVATSANLDEIAVTEKLYNNLQGLVDEKGKVQEKDKALASYIIEELNTALGTEIKLNNGIIENYKEIGSLIEDNIQKKKAQIVLNASEEKMTEALKTQLDAEKELSEQISLKVGLLQEQEEAQNRVDTAREKHLENLSKYGTNDIKTVASSNELMLANTELAKVTKEVETNMIGIDEAIGIINDTLAETANFEQLNEMLESGNYQGVIDSFTKIGTSTKDAIIENRDATTDELDITLERLNIAYAGYRNSESDAEKKYYSDQVINLAKQGETLALQSKANGVGGLEGLIKGLSDPDKLLDIEARGRVAYERFERGYKKAANQNSPSKKMENNAIDTMKGALIGLDKMSIPLSNKGKDISNAIQKPFENQNISKTNNSNVNLNVYAQSLNQGEVDNLVKVLNMKLGVNV